MARVARGIVMELNSNSAVIMTNDGEFLRVKKPSGGTTLGEEITSKVLEDSSYLHRFKLKVKQKKQQIPAEREELEDSKASIC